MLDMCPCTSLQKSLLTCGGQLLFLEILLQASEKLRHILQLRYM